MVDQGFPPQARIRRRSEYLALQRRARRFHTRDFVLLYRPGGTDRSRVGITVSRRVGPAVVRNRIKRWVREFARKNAGSLSGNWDVVVIARSSAARIEHSQADLQLAEFFDHLTRLSPFGGG